MIFAALLGIGLALAIPLAAFGGAIGQGIASAGALQAIGRQPEAARDIQTNMLIALAFIESLVLYALLTFFLLMGRLPAVMDVISKATGQQ
jgi:F-type H+-transporting ATPase subunit c